MANQVKFYKVNGLTKSGLTVGGIYFDKTTGIIHVATSATTTDEFGVGVKSATLVNNVLEIVNQDGDKFSVDFKDIASASSVQTALNTKLNIGEPGDDASIQSYYGLKADIVASTNDMATNADVDNKIAEQAAAIAAAKTVVTKKAGDHVTVTKSAGTDGNDVYTIAESDIASAQALSGVDGRVAAIETLLAEDGDTTISNLKDVIDYFNGVKEEETGAALISQVSTNKANIEAIESDYLTSTDKTELAGATTAVSNRVQTIENSYVKSVATTHVGGSFIAVTPDATDGAVTINVDETALNTKIVALETAIGKAEDAGVTSFGGKTGAVTVRGSQNTNGAVNLAMSDNELQASIVGLGSAAYTDANAYATAAQGDLADTAIQRIEVTGSTYDYLVAEEPFDDMGGRTASLQISVSEDISQETAIGDHLADAYAVKTYVDSQVTSALEWAEFK